jgi:hypothetical protein
MRYTLDQVAEKLIHALCEAVVLRHRLALKPDSMEATILNDVIEDLATGLGLHINLPVEREPVVGSLQHFVHAVRRCQTPRHVATAFQGIPALAPFLIAPYFSQTDLHALENPT